jgi:AcrR family transcriptional regulator
VLRRISAAGAPARERDLRPQGRKTMRRLLDAGIRVFGERGFHTARVDDIVRAARTSHGTFYLYFSNKEDLLRTLAVECAHQIEALAGDAGHADVRVFLDEFMTTYRRYGPVIRAWMEGNVDDREVSSLGVRAFTGIANALGERMERAGAASDDASIAALMALLERLAYFCESRDLDVDTDALLSTVTVLVERGFLS